MFPTMNDAIDEINPRIRELYLTDGNSAILEASDPYGLWAIRWKNGKTPVELKGQAFTSADQARQYLNTWLNANKYDTKITDKPVEIPELKVKRVVNG